jgi:circadian clock protein KaiB
MMKDVPEPRMHDAAVAPEVPFYRLRLYVAGELPNSVQALGNLRSVCEACLPGRHDVEVIDFFDSPQRALADGVIVTPTLVRLEPEPRQVVVGNLTDRATLLRALDLQEEL